VDDELAFVHVRLRDRCSGKTDVQHRLEDRIGQSRGEAGVVVAAAWGTTLMVVTQWRILTFPGLEPLTGWTTHGVVDEATEARVGIHFALGGDG